MLCCLMIAHGDFQIIDWTLFIAFNLVNILMIGIFLSLPKELKYIEQVLGIVLIIPTIPVTISLFTRYILSCRIDL